MRFVDVDGKTFEGNIEEWAFMPLSPHSKYTKDALHKTKGN